MNKVIISLLFLGLSLAAGGENTVDLEAVPELPVLPDPLESGEIMEPEITIIRKDNLVIEEYRVNGMLYMAKITPSIGPAYYLIDSDGDGKMDSKRKDFDDAVAPQWVLFSW